MTAVLIALAITLPPSAAAVAIYWLEYARAAAKQLGASQIADIADAHLQIKVLSASARALRADVDNHDKQISNLNDKI